MIQKVLIYLSNGWNNEFTNNKLSRALKKYVYLAYDPDDFIKYLHYIRENKYLLFQKHESANLFCKLKKIKCRIFRNICNRDNFKKKLDPVENPASFIAQYLLYD